jgi:cytochrome c-type biogenesis protein CcmH
MTLFIVFAILLTAFAVALIVFPLLRQSDERPNAPVAATIMAIVLPALVLLLYVSISNHSWETQSSTAPAEASSAVALDQAVATLEDRLSREPDDVDGWLLLGRTYFELQDISKARSAFARALALDPSAEAKLGIAEADIMMDRSALAGDAGRLVEEVLLLEPRNPKALFYGGLVASVRGDFSVVRQRWETLLTLSPPPAVVNMIKEQLASLPAGAAGPAQVAPETAPSPSSGDGINVRVDIAQNLVEKIKPGAMLFLVAREPDKPGPPMAAVRQGASSFPTLMRITDANAMLPGKSLAAIARVHLVARIANGGDPIAQPGDIFGEVIWTRTDGDGQSPEVHILMDEVVE